MTKVRKVDRRDGVGCQDSEDDARRELPQPLLGPQDGQRTG